MAWSCTLRSTSLGHSIDLDSGSDWASIGDNLHAEQSGMDQNLGHGSAIDCAATVVLSPSQDDMILSLSQATPDIEDNEDISDTSYLSTHGWLPNMPTTDHGMCSGNPVTGSSLANYDPWNTSCPVVKQLIGDAKRPQITNSEYDDINDLRNWRPWLPENEIISNAALDDENVDDEDVGDEIVDDGSVVAAQDSSDDSMSTDSYSDSDESSFLAPPVSGGCGLDDMDECVHCRFCSFCSACGSELRVPV